MMAIVMEASVQAELQSLFKEQKENMLIRIGKRTAKD